MLQSLEQAELISIVSANGRPCAVKPGKPVFATAFRQLTRDRVLAARLDAAALGEQVRVENAAIRAAVEELHLLGELPRIPRELGERVQWLMRKVQVGQRKIEQYEREAARLKLVLSSEY